MVGTSLERRNYLRRNMNFATKIKILRTSEEAEGVTQDLSQGGAFILSTSWRAFQQDDQTETCLLLPPELTGQPKTVLLRGPAVVKRIQGESGGIALQFLKEVKTFEASW
jgi:c-di-GMP-binding flagellar brake protein YcgR